MKYNARGHELPDRTPVAIPVRLTRPPTMAEQVRELVRGELSRQAAASGLETWEEADDFDIGDDFDPSSPYELNFDQEDERGDPKETPAPAGNEGGIIGTQGTANQTTGAPATGIQPTGQTTQGNSAGNTGDKQPSG